MITVSADSSASSSSSPVCTESVSLGIVSTIVVVSTSNIDTRGPHWHNKLLPSGVHYKKLYDIMEFYFILFTQLQAWAQN